ncbi:YlbF family regulator [Paenibacillus sp. SI8]|uniref:YlbF family regulator n=1 Tax=unclassified Paenibacillus TaxID=185978 RepID=UPI0034658675
MNVHDKAYDLARAIKESSEYKDMKDSRSKVEADPSSKTMLDDFRKRQTELQQKMMAGEMPPQDEMEQVQKLYEVLALNPNINRLFDAERRLSLVLEDVQRIIAEPLEAMLK